MRKVSGIYAIFLKDEAIYVGQSVNCWARRLKHLNDLKLNKHHNPILQRIYNKTEDKSLVTIDLIDDVPDENLGYMEQYWMNMLSPKTNIMPGGGITSLEWRNRLSKKYTGRPNLKLRGKKLSPEQIQKRTETRRKNGWFKNINETSKKMSATHQSMNNGGRFKKGVASRLGTKASPETIEKLRKSHLGYKVKNETKEKLRACFIGKKQPQWAVDKRASALRAAHAKRREEKQKLLTNLKTDIKCH